MQWCHTGPILCHSEESPSAWRIRQPLQWNSGILPREHFFVTASEARPFLAWWYPHANGHGTQPCQAILKDGWKLVHWMNQKETELYRLDDDVGEKNYLAKKEPKKAHELLQTLNKWVKDTGRN